MRLEQTIPLDAEGGRKVTVREMTVEHVRNLRWHIANKDLDFLGAALDGDMAPLIALLGDCIELPEIPCELTFSEIDMIRAAFEALHPSFFAQAALQNLAALATTKLASSTALAASSLSADTPA